MGTEHISNAPHASQAGALYAELMDMIAKRDAALAERDRLRQEVIDLACQHMRACDDRDRLRDAARAFLDLLKQRVIAASILAGPELDALREACK